MSAENIHEETCFITETKLGSEKTDSGNRNLTYDKSALWKNDFRHGEVKGS